MSGELPVQTQSSNAFKSVPAALRRVIVTVLIVLGGVVVGWIGRGVLTGAPWDATTAAVYPISRDAQTGTVTQGWQVICPTSKEKDRACEITRDVFDDKSNQRIGRLAIITEKGKKIPSLVMTVPLGVLLRPGIGLRLGGDPAKNYPYTTCDAGGCSAIVPFDGKIKASLANSQDAAFVIATPQDRNGIEVPFSLKRFGEVYSAYRAGEAKRKYMWWRFWL